MNHFKLKDFVQNFVVITSSSIKSESIGLAVHLSAAHNAKGIKMTYTTIVVAAIDTK